MNGKAHYISEPLFFSGPFRDSQILTDLAFHLADCGIEVRVVTSQQRYDDPDAHLPEAESIGGVAIHRISTTRFGRSALIGRGFDYFSFYTAACRSVLAWAKPGDLLVAKTDPPLLCVAAKYAAKRRGLHLVNWLQDLYPEVAAALGVPFTKGPLGRALLELRDASLRAAAANVVVGEGMAEVLRRRGISPEMIRVIPNWCDDEEIQPIAPLDNPLRREWGLEDRFVVGYSGNLGRGHEFETVLAAAERLRGDQRLCFLFIGGGKKFRRACSLYARAWARPFVSLSPLSGEKGIKTFSRRSRHPSDFAEARTRRPDRAE